MIFEDKVLFLFFLYYNIIKYFVGNWASVKSSKRDLHSSWKDVMFFIYLIQTKKKKKNLWCLFFREHFIITTLYEALIEHELTIN